MDALRTLTSALGHYDPDAADNSPQANYRKAVRLTAQLGSLVATLGRVNAGGGPIAPDPVLGHAANFLYMLTGERPSGLATRAFDVALVLHADHELNASTFAARVAAATLTDIHSTIVGAIGALKGPLHGGANADVMRMLLEIGKDAGPDRAAEVVRAKLARKEKIPGFGHRVYHTEDPRATHLRQMSRELCQRAGMPEWFEMSQRIEAVVKAEKKLNPNVDFYSATTYYALGIPINLFTPIFAVSRISGWTAHVLEQYANNRLIRPRAEYHRARVSAAVRTGGVAIAFARGSRRLRSRRFGQKLLYKVANRVTGLGVEAAARLARESRVDLADEAIAPEEDRRGERVQVFDLRHLLGELVGEASQEHRVADPVSGGVGFQARRVLKLRSLLE